MLQMRLYALYKRSNKVLVPLAICFLVEIGVMMRIYINFSTTVEVTNQPLPGVYFCGSTSYGRWISYSVYPTLSFEVVLCSLCVWLGYQRSKDHFSAPGLRWSRARLVDILIGGNVLYFFSFSLTWVVGTVTLFIYGVRVYLTNHADWIFLSLDLQLQWGQAVNAFGAATSIIAGCRLILDLREATSPVVHSTVTSEEGVVFMHQLSTISHA
ncbi:hypothetical protein J3A83DRAFT_1131027 [Scleroderma citrinum]